MHNTLTRRRQVRAIFILRECAASSPRHRRAGEWLLLTTANLLSFSFKRTQNLLPSERMKKSSTTGAIRRAIKVAAGVDWSIQGHQGLASLSLSSRKRSLMAVLFLACDHYTRGINVKSYYTHYHACVCGRGRLCARARARADAHNDGICFISTRLPWATPRRTREMLTLYI